MAAIFAAWRSWQSCGARASSIEINNEGAAVNALESSWTHVSVELEASRLTAPARCEP